jgi:hypothetical protein
MAENIQVTVLWDMILYSAVGINILEKPAVSIFRVEDEKSRFLLYAGTYLPNYTVSHSRT